MTLTRLTLPATLLLSVTNVFAAGIAGEIEEMFVTASKSRAGLQGEAEAASVGTVLADQLAHRPVQRPAEVLETIPGMVITQHSGEGKANQYFLRGFNLDHATDFATSVEGAPVNNVSHGHGQGYSDLNFLIPELVERLVYKKGPYYASEGDFSTAGSSRIFYKNIVNDHTAKLTLGEDGYKRALITGGTRLATANFVYGLEVSGHDGPWDIAQDHQKANAYLKLAKGDNANGLSLSAIIFDSDWNSTDQIPNRLVEGGQLDRFGSLDPTTGGDTHRHQLSYQQWSDFGPATQFQANAYWVDYKLSLTTNATYFASQTPSVSPIIGTTPSQIGDQFTQFDERSTYGGSVHVDHESNDQHRWRTGAALRIDDIGDLGVGSSLNQHIYATTYRGNVEEMAISTWASLQSQWTNWLTSIVGVRYDRISAEVNTQVVEGTTEANAIRLASGDADADTVSPKLSLRFGPFNQTEFFLNYGEGFHSNDARGSVGEQAVPLISGSTGYEVGLRSALIEDLQFTAVWFWLELDSELVFVGDDGTTEPHDETERQGVELGLIYQPTDWLLIDADYARSKARFRERQFDGDDLLGDHVPDAIRDVLSIGASLSFDNGVFGGLQYRYFGPRELTESGDIRSNSTALLNANIGYALPNNVSLNLEVLNLLDNEDDDITYWYESRTKEERTAGLEAVADFHAHPMIPRTLRASISYTF